MSNSIGNSSCGLGDAIYDRAPEPVPVHQLDINYVRDDACPSCRQCPDDDPNEESEVALSAQTGYHHYFCCPTGHVEVRRFCSCGHIYEYSVDWP